MFYFWDRTDNSSKLIIQHQTPENGSLITCKALQGSIEVSSTVQVFGATTTTTELTTTTTTEITTSREMKTPPRNESSCCTSPKKIEDESADFDTSGDGDEASDTFENRNKKKKLLYIIFSRLFGCLGNSIFVVGFFDSRQVHFKYCLTRLTTPA